MTPVLTGRLQTRALLAALVTLPVIAVLGTLLGLGIARAIVAGLVAGALSVAWEPAWHGLQQLRWDRDWPSALALLAGIPEAAAAKLVLAWLCVLPLGAHWATFTTVFAAAWLLAWLAQQGPLRVLFPAARFDGDRLLRRHAPASATRTLRLAATETTPLTHLLAAAPMPSRAKTEGGTTLVKTRPRKSTSSPRPPARGAATSERRRGPRRGMAIVGVVTVLAFLAFTVIGLGPHDSNTPAARRQTGPAVHHRAPARMPDAQPWSAPQDQAVLNSWNTRASVSPYAITIPRLVVQAGIDPVAMTHGTIARPAKRGDAGWYTATVAPGRTGAAVLIGSMQHGPFARLGQLVSGDTVLVTRSDATTVQYVVDRVQTVPAAGFPAAAVYRHTRQPTLRLVGFSPRVGTHGTYTLVFATATHLLHPRSPS